MSPFEIYDSQSLLGLIHSNVYFYNDDVSIDGII